MMSEPFRPQQAMTSRSAPSEPCKLKQQESNDELLRQELRHRSDLPGADGCFVGEPRRQMERLHRPLNVAH